MPGLSTAQRASILESTGAVNGCEGSIRSGKTIASLIRWAEFTTAAPDGHLALLGWTLTTIQRNVLDPLANLHPSIVQHTRGNNVAHIMGREVQLVGFSDKRSEAVIRGLTLAGAYVDEATLMPEQTFVQLLGRLSIDGSKLFFTTNPDSQSHWLRPGPTRTRSSGWTPWPPPPWPGCCCAPSRTPAPTSSCGTPTATGTNRWRCCG